MRGHSVKAETIAIHGGYDVDPTTKAVAVPIYQTVAYAFDSADHGAALFNLEVEGFRYSRISNPTTAVLERRVAELDGGCGGLAGGTGQAASAPRPRRAARAPRGPPWRRPARAPSPARRPSSARWSCCAGCARPWATSWC